MYRIYSILMGYSNTVSCDVDTVLDKKMKKYNFLSLENMRFVLVKLTKKRFGSDSNRKVCISI